MIVKIIDFLMELDREVWFALVACSTLLLFTAYAIERYGWIAGLSGLFCATVAFAITYFTIRENSEDDPNPVLQYITGSIFGAMAFAFTVWLTQPVAIIEKESEPWTIESGSTAASIGIAVIVIVIWLLTRSSDEEQKKSLESTAAGCGCLIASLPMLFLTCLAWSLSPLLGLVMLVITIYSSFTNVSGPKQK